MINNVGYLLTALITSLTSIESGIFINGTCKIDSASLVINYSIDNNTCANKRIFSVPQTQTGLNITPELEVHLFDADMKEIASAQNKEFKLAKPARRDYITLYPMTALSCQCETQLSDLYYKSERYNAGVHFDYNKVVYFKIVYDDNFHLFKNAQSHIESSIIRCAH